MILADPSVWVDHLRGRSTPLAKLLEAGQILTHPFVVGELALGHLEPREVILRNLQDLPHSLVASHEEVIELVERQSLYGFGIGYVDANLLASVLLTEGASLWTHDKRLRSAVERLGLGPRLPA